MDEGMNMRKVFKFQGQAPHLVPKDTKVVLYDYSTTC